MTSPDSLAQQPEAEAAPPPTPSPQPSTEATAAGDEPAGDPPAGDLSAVAVKRRPGVSRRQVLAFGATTAGALTVGGIVGAAVQRGVEAARIPPTVAPEALLNDASRLNPTPVRGVIF